MNAICNLNENEAWTKPTSPFKSYRPVFRTSLKPIKILMGPGSPPSSENQALIGQKGKGNSWLAFADTGGGLGDGRSVGGINEKGFKGVGGKAYR